MKKKWPFILFALLLASACNKDTLTAYTVYYKVTSNNATLTNIRYINGAGALITDDTLHNGSTWVSPTFSASQGTSLSVYAYCKSMQADSPQVSIFVYFSDNRCPDCGEYFESDSARAAQGKKVVSDSIVNYILPH